MGISVQEPTGQSKIVKRAIQGDSEAFSTLFDQYFNAIYRYLVSLSGDEDTADDLAQETFIRAHRNLHRLGPPYAIRPWLYRIAHNTFINHIKGSKSAVSLDSDLQIASDEPGPEHQVLNSAWAGPVGSALKRLAPSYREALILRELDGFQYNEIAEVMGVSLENVKVVLHRARASFKDHYGLRVLAEDPLPDCEVLGDLLDSFADGEFTTPEQDRLLRDHLKQCDSCQQRKRKIAAMALLLRGLDVPQPSDALKKRVWRKSTRKPFKWSAAINMVVLGIFLGGFGAAAIQVAKSGFGGNAGDATQAPDNAPVMEQNFTPALTPTGGAVNAPPASGLTTQIYDVANCTWIGGDQFQWYQVEVTYQDGQPINMETLSGPYSGYWQPNCPAAPADSGTSTDGGIGSEGDTCRNSCGNRICERICGEDPRNCRDC